jgi:hypothetical protein
MDEWARTIETASDRGEGEVPVPEGVTVHQVKKLLRRAAQDLGMIVAFRPHQRGWGRVVRFRVKGVIDEPPPFWAYWEA